MTDWQMILDTKFAVPRDRPIGELVAQLVPMLRSPDPVIRDRFGYSILSTWIARGELDAYLGQLGDAMAARFGDPEIQARTFAPLILAEVIGRGRFEQTWLSAFERWYRTETDLRGLDPRLGWLHAVAHGADLLGAFGAAEQLTAADLTGLLDLATVRLLTRTTHVFDAWEDDRLADAIARVLSRLELSREQAVEWLAPVAADFTRRDWSVPVPAHAVNTMHTLRMLYLLIDRGFRLPGVEGEPIQVWHREAILEALLDVLRLTSRHLG
ncbi:hypothetical protein F4553_006482 [Allocatelliglobosispora scoriae]|uniref:DUF2785 domain-containing protein n=1 Tax=Allocatelliglobosispora scoriae TaxID=643052 RepID=A0A841BZX4_9ACTN|nr:DUF2785 domain-containing protein [Allocatelliglobosispora scoriae]MBB5873048.1 hypothetical protein [Allocatelliglobosispora scoriae]